MKSRNDSKLRRVMNISNKSGCVATSYNIINNDEVWRVEENENEFSGECEFRKGKKN